MLWASLLAQLVKSACNMGDSSSIPGSGSSPREGKGNPSSILAWKIPWTEEPGGLQSMRSQRVGHEWGFPGGSEVKVSASNVGDLGSIPGSGRSPGEGNGNSSILAWRIPWTEKPGRLQSMGSQRVGHN